MLQKDYTVLEPVVNVLLNPQYDDLWLNDEMTLPQTLWQSRAELATKLFTEITNELTRVTYINASGNLVVARPTETLVTKIMLGTTGCIPAYDRYVIAGLKKEGLTPILVNSQSYLKLLAALSVYANDFNHATAQLARIHPPMKLIDMWLWERGR